MKPIGGYFELELNNYGEYPKNAIALNTGRNALEYILRVYKFIKIYIPYFTCEVILEPLNKLGIQYEFYHLTLNLEPKINSIEKFAALLYTNYFGVLDDKVNVIVKKYTNVIIDSCQAFFSKPNNSALATFYSCRKFFGVPDGAYLYIKKKLRRKFEQDTSESRLSHLIKRIEYGPEAGYKDFRNNDSSLCGQPIKTMSYLTRRILSSVDYGKVEERRKENFLYLHEHFGKINEFKFKYTNKIIPMVYPLLIDGGSSLKKKLIDNRIFVATYWPNVKNWVDKTSFEYYLANNLVALPVDQRYILQDMKRIVRTING